jgi:hypothetical protein
MLDSESSPSDSHGKWLVKCEAPRLTRSAKSLINNYSGEKRTLYYNGYEIWNLRWDRGHLSSPALLQKQMDLIYLEEVQVDSLNYMHAKLLQII